MKRILSATFLITIVLSFLTCHKSGHYYIFIHNKSNKTIIWQPRFYKYGDLAEEAYSCGYIFGGRIPCDSTHEFELTPDTWEQTLDNHYLQLTVIDDSVFSRYASEPCDTIRKYVPALHSYRLSLKDLEHMNWTVVYPPEKQVHYEGDINP